MGGIVSCREKRSAVRSLSRVEQFGGNGSQEEACLGLQAQVEQVDQRWGRCLSVLYSSFGSLGGGVSQTLQGNAGSAQILKGRGRAGEVRLGLGGGLGFPTPSITIAPNSAQTADRCWLITQRWAPLGKGCPVGQNERGQPLCGGRSQNERLKRAEF